MFFKRFLNIVFLRDERETEFFCVCIKIICWKYLGIFIFWKWVNNGVLSMMLEELSDIRSGRL